VREKVPPARDDVRENAPRLGVDAGVRLYLAVDELPGEAVCRLGGQYLLCAVREFEGARVGEPELLFGAQSALRGAGLEGVLGYERGLLGGAQVLLRV
jgi:hypothetical protein